MPGKSCSLYPVGVLFEGRKKSIKPIIFIAELICVRPECDRDLYDLLRIESGIPEIDHEISDEYIPLEANLWGDVSFSKGCYIGQEIIARMESRGKLAKMLVGVESASPLMAGTKIEGWGDHQCRRIAAWRLDRFGIS